VPKGAGVLISGALGYFGDVHAVVIDPASGWRYGWSDGRAGGRAAGY
jgi:hypothetical protein